jgi:hypothetical protein
MSTIEERTTKDGKTVYRVKVRRKGSMTQTATFARLTDARKWAQVTEVAILEGRHFKKTEAKYLDVHFVSPVPIGAGLVPAQPRATTRVAPTLQLAVYL